MRGGGVSVDCARASGILSGRFEPHFRTMIELNPIRQRIADLQDRLASLRGYL